MVKVSFDPLAAARELEAAGIEHYQAAASARGVRMAAAADRGQLACWTDIRWNLAILCFQSAILLLTGARLFENL